jgi:hypothetical protein
MAFDSLMKATSDLNTLRYLCPPLRTNPSILSAVHSCIWIAVFSLSLSLHAQNGTNPSVPKQTPSFGPKWTALVGQWVAETVEGGGSGACGFHFDLEQNVIVRTNRAELPGPGGQARVHADLMVISPRGSQDEARATYWDNEGHRIEYSAGWSSDGSTLTLLSEAGPGPLFRLTYKRIGAESMTVLFEMAPPGKAEAFKQYTTGRIRRLSR